VGNISVQGLGDWGFDPRLRGTLDLSYYYGGGLGVGSLTLPVQRQAQGAVQFIHLLSRVDTLTTRAQVSQALFSNGPIAQTFVLSEAWRTRLSRTTEFDLGVGPSLVRSARDRATPPANLPFAFAQTAVRSQLRYGGHRFDLEGLASLSPFVDWITGVGYERVDLSASLRWLDPQDRFGGLARARGAFTVASTQPAPPQSLASLEASISYAPQTDLKIEMGSRIIWQRVPTFGNQPFWEWLTYVSLTVTQRGIL
jgi:hypothetical protein